MSDSANISELLQQQRSTVEQRLLAIQADFAKGRSEDSAEQALENENDDALNEIQREAEKELTLIDAALEKLKNGKYGYCDSCGEEIDRQRLQALPYAIQCIHCAQGETDAH